MRNYSTLSPSARQTPTNQATNMKTLINITAHAYAGSKLIAAERTYSFIRAASAKKPTHFGAARMVAAELGCKPADVSVARVEAMCYSA